MMPSTPRSIMASATLKDGTEVDGTLYYQYIAGHPGSYEQPPDPAEAEITAFRDEGGEDVSAKLTDAELERLADVAIEHEQSLPDGREDEPEVDDACT